MKHAVLRPKSPAALLAAVRLARSEPGAMFPVPGGFPLTSAQLLAFWRKGVDARASRGLKALSPDEEESFEDLRWDAARVNEWKAGIRHSGCRNLLRTPAMKRRYPHIDNQPVNW